MGSWKIIEIFSPRIRVRISSSDRLSRSCPSNSMEPLGIRPVRSGSSRRMASAVVVLPAPVSPTSPRVSPLFRVRLTPFTAWTGASPAL